MTGSVDRISPNASLGELDPAAPRCPHCEYLLLGLAEPRCPECGRETTWEAAREAGARLVSIAFERARGVVKAPAALVTWLTVVFLPWVFATQAAKRLSVPHGVVFGMLCFAGASGATYWGAASIDMTAWFVAALTQICAQALVLAGLDAKHRDQYWASVGFWLAAGGYTSAIMVTEVIHGPPLFIFHDFLDLLERLAGGTPSRTFPSWPDSIWPYLQVVSWLAALSTLLVARTRRFDAVGVLIGLMAAVLLFVMYMLCVEYVGVSVFNFLDHAGARVVGPFGAP